MAYTSTTIYAKVTAPSVIVNMYRKSDMVYLGTWNAPAAVTNARTIDVYQDQVYIPQMENHIKNDSGVNYSATYVYVLNKLTGAIENTIECWSSIPYATEAGITWGYGIQVCPDGIYLAMGYAGNNNRVYRFKLTGGKATDNFNYVDGTYANLCQDDQYIYTHFRGATGFSTIYKRPKKNLADASRDRTFGTVEWINPMTVSQNEVLTYNQSSNYWVRRDKTTFNETSAHVAGPAVQYKVTCDLTHFFTERYQSSGASKRSLSTLAVVTDSTANGGWYVCCENWYEILYPSSTVPISYAAAFGKGSGKGVSRRRRIPFNPNSLT